MPLILKSICWILAVYFFITAHAISGYPPSWTADYIFSISFSIFLFLLPFAKSLSFGNFLKFEAQIEHVKEDVEAFKAETRNILAVQTSVMSNVTQSVAQNTTFNIPTLTAADSAEKQIDENSSNVTNNQVIQEMVKKYLSGNALTPNLALAKLRMDLELELRSILGKRTRLGEKVDIKFMSIRTLERELVVQFPKMQYLSEAFSYVNDICNAAVHGQIVPNDHAEEALSIGLRILAELRSLKED